MNKPLSIASLSLITVCSVDSIRNLPVAAIAGSQLFNYFILALVLFLLPIAILASWFSKQSQQGIYGWVKQGLGQRLGFMAIWFQCIQNLLIYPTFLSFIAGTLLYSFSPQLAENNYLIFFTIIVLIWCLTWINLKGIQTSSRFNSFCTLAGLLMPFLTILTMGLFWYFSHRDLIKPILPPATPYSWTALTAIMLSFCGIEIAAVHAKESKPGAITKAIFIAVIVVFFTMLFGSITLAMIIPAQQLNFVSSIPRLIEIFFNELHCGPLAFLMNALIAIGCIGTANNWIIAPIKGLSFAINEGVRYTKLIEKNARQVPARLLILQAGFVSIISLLFLVFPAINTSYWVMLNSATQVYLLMYFMLCLSAIKLIFNRKSYSWIILLSAFLGLSGISIGLIVSLVPPPSLPINSHFIYGLLSIFFLVFLILAPLTSLGRKPIQA